MDDRIPRMHHSGTQFELVLRGAPFKVRVRIPAYKVVLILVGLVRLWIDIHLGGVPQAATRSKTHRNSMSYVPESLP